MASVLKTCACPNKGRCAHGWIVRYREPGGRAGRVRQHSFPTKRHASAFAAQIEADKAAGTYLDPARGQISFADYAAEYLASRILRPTTYDQYVRNLRNHTLPRFGHLPLTGITRAQIQNWITQLTDTGLGPRTIANIYGVFAGILRNAVLDERLPRSPCTAIHLPEPPPTTVRLLTPDQVRTLAAAMRPRYALTVLLAYGTGTRQGETFAATSSCINLDTRTLTVDQQNTLINTNPHGYSARPVISPPKTKASYRTVPLPGFVTDAHRQHLDVRVEADQDLLFTSPTPTHHSTATTTATASGSPPSAPPAWHPIPRSTT